MNNQMRSEEANITCLWRKPDNSPCKDTRLVTGSQYCYKHYWQALWAKTNLTELVLPVNTNWVFLAILFIPFLLVHLRYFINPSSASPRWLYEVVLAFGNIQFTFTQPALIFKFLGWLSVGITTIVSFVLFSLIFCSFPLKPRIRRYSILVGLFLHGVFSIIKIVALVVLGAKYHQIEYIWLFTSFANIGVFQIMLLVFWAADTLNSRIYSNIGIWLLGISTIIWLAVSIFFLSLASEPIEWTLMRLGGATWGLLIGFQLLRWQGRTSIARFFTELSIELADNMRPLEPYMLGFTQLTPNVRRLALEKALRIYSNLTPVEQDELEIYLLSKRRPSVAQVFLGLITIVLSAFFLEAPAQQAFIWFACKFLQLGNPFCP